MSWTSSKVVRPRGPWDREETDVDEGDDSYIDLGGLVVKGIEGVELRLQVEDQQGTIAAVMFAGPDSGLELRAFAAPRSGGIWDEVRADIAAEADPPRRDGERVRRRVRHGADPEGAGPDTRRQAGHSAVPHRRCRRPSLAAARHVPRQERPSARSRGCRWRPRSADVIVVRGNDPMAPRDMIRMQMPAQAQAQMLDQAQEPPDEDLE